MFIYDLAELVVGAFGNIRTWSAVWSSVILKFCHGGGIKFLNRLVSVIGWKGRRKFVFRSQGRVRLLHGLVLDSRF